MVGRQRSVGGGVLWRMQWAASSLARVLGSTVGSSAGSKAVWSVTEGVTRISSTQNGVFWHLCCRRMSAKKFGNVRVWPINIYCPNLANFGILLLRGWNIFMFTVFVFFVGHAVNNINELAADISLMGCQNGAKFSRLTEEALLYITTYIGELWPKDPVGWQNSVGVKNSNAFFVSLHRWNLTRWRVLVRSRS